VKCQYCGYEWKAKIKNPISCPRCKRRFDYPTKEVKNETN